MKPPPILAIALAAALFALGGCATTAATRPDRPAAALGQAARVGPLTIEPLVLIEDSRCPVEVKCIWAGRLVIRAAVTIAGRRDTRDLTLGTPQPVGQGQLVLAAATPVKRATAVLRPRNYRFIFAYTAGL